MVLFFIEKISKKKFNSFVTEKKKIFSKRIPIFLTSELDKVFFIYTKYKGHYNLNFYA